MNGAVTREQLLEMLCGDRRFTKPARARRFWRLIDREITVRASSAAAALNVSFTARRAASAETAEPCHYAVIGKDGCLLLLRLPRRLFHTLAATHEISGLRDEALARYFIALAGAGLRLAECRKERPAFVECISFDIRAERAGEIFTVSAALNTALAAKAAFYAQFIAPDDFQCALLSLIRLIAVVSAEANVPSLASLAAPAAQTRFGIERLEGGCLEGTLVCSGFVQRLALRD